MAQFTLLILLVLHILLVITCMIHILLHKRNPQSAMGWLVACAGIPLLGVAAYYLFGINRILTRARKLGRTSNVQFSEPAEEILEHHPLAAIGNRVLAAALTRQNVVRPLANGEEAYPAMLAAIDQAQSTVWLSTYIFSNDKVGAQFIDALERAKLRGVNVAVLIDGIGELYSWPKISTRLRKRDIPFVQFLKPGWFPFRAYMNLRNHRKLLICDSRHGFLGGMNIGERHMLDKDDKRHVDDLHFETLGPAVAELAQVFLEDWQFTAGGQLNVGSADIGVIPTAAEGANSICRVVRDGPNEDFGKLSMILLGVVTSAKQSVSVMTPYFIPGNELAAAFKAAALRGVRVTIAIPQHSNLAYVDWATTHQLTDLLLHGVEIYRTHTFSHAKLLTIDQDYCLIGSSNLDPRSLRLNFEIGLEVFEHGLNQQLTKFIQQKTHLATLITAQQLSNLPLAKRLRNGAANLMSPYL